MQTATETTDILNDLVLINNDRIAGYEKAIDELNATTGPEDNSDLRELFHQMIVDSQENRDELARQLRQLNATAETGTMTSGKLYRAWMDVKALFTGKSRHAILEACEGGEDAAQKAYKDALEEDLSESTRLMLQHQQEILKMAHNEIKTLRDESQP